MILMLALLPTAGAVGQPKLDEAQSAPQLAPLANARILPSPFPIEIVGDLGGLDIAVEAGGTGVDAYVRLVSNHITSVRCNVLFRNGPESRQRRVQLAPQQPRMVTGGLRRSVHPASHNFDLWSRFVNIRR